MSFEENLLKVDKQTKQDVNIVDVVGPEGITKGPMPDLIKSAERKKFCRKRKKHHYNAIRSQMEFYFGDANLTKDRFLNQLINKDPYVPLEVFMTFNKIKTLTSKVEDIAKSLNNSQLLELDEVQQKVKRKIPLAENRNVDEKTLYVEALPSTADHEWVRQIFERFGKVSYISLPKYLKSRKIKEFGFVEFEKEESISKAIKAFQKFNGVLSMQEKDPSELISIKSYIKEQSTEKEEHEECTTAVDCRKILKRASEEEDSPKAKKCKIHPQEEFETSNTENATTTKSESESVSEKPHDDKEKSPKKKKRKRKKKSKAIDKLKLKAELNTDVVYYELKILPKKDWKRLRNKYLNLQREKIGDLKRKAWRQHQELRHQKDTIIMEDNALPAAQQEQIKNKSNAKRKLHKMNMNFYGAAEEDSSVKLSITEKNTNKSSVLKKEPLFSYEPGLIVEISFLEPCVNIKEFKDDMRQYNFVKYVDIKEGAMLACVRLETSQKATEFVQRIGCAEYQCKILSNEAESNYWKKIEQDREQKLNKQVKVPQKRGREKVKKFISKHIRFGDDE